jgi:hypothetical protein
LADLSVRKYKVELKKRKKRRNYWQIYPPGNFNMTDTTLWRKYSANIYIEEARVIAGHLEKGKSIFSYFFLR